MFLDHPCTGALGDRDGGSASRCPPRAPRRRMRDCRTAAALLSPVRSRKPICSRSPTHRLDATGECRPSVLHEGCRHKRREAANGIGRPGNRAYSSLRRETRGRARHRRRRHAALRMADDGSAHPSLRSPVRGPLGSSSRRCSQQLHLGAAPGLPGGWSRSWRRGHRSGDHLCGHRRRRPILRRHSRSGRGSRAVRPVPRPRRCPAADHAAHRAVCAVHYAGYAAPLKALAEICDEHGLALLEDAAHSPSAEMPQTRERLGTVGLAGAFSFFSNKIISCGEGGLLATRDDGVAELARSRRSHAMTSGTWDRHRGHARGYDVVRWATTTAWTSRAPRCWSARLPGLDADIRERRS